MKYKYRAALFPTRTDEGVIGKEAAAEAEVGTRPTRPRGKEVLKGSNLRPYKPYLN